jgi:predicted alpha/beta hydrolase
MTLSTLLLACRGNKPTNGADTPAVSNSLSQDKSFRVTTFDDGAARLCYRTEGSGRILVFLAGGPGLSTAYIEPLANHFTRSNTVMLFDQRGTGCSSVSPANADTLTVAASLNDLEALRHQLNLPYLRLYGHSMGRHARDGIRLSLPVKSFVVGTFGFRRTGYKLCWTVQQAHFENTQSW